MGKPILTQETACLYDRLCNSGDYPNANALQAMYFLATGRTGEPLLSRYDLAGTYANEPPVAWFHPEKHALMEHEIYIALAAQRPELAKGYVPLGLLPQPPQGEPHA